MLKTLTTFLIGIVFAAVSSVSADARNPEVMKVALLPDENASKLIQRNQPLKKYLENSLDKEIELVVTTDYSSMIEAMRFGRIDIAYFGPLSYVMAQSKAEIEPFAALVTDGRAEYRSIILGSSEKGIDSYTDLKGKNVAFGDQASTSSHLMPRNKLLKEGLTAEDDYTPRYTGTHDAAAVAVMNGNVAGGALSEKIWNFMVEGGRANKNDVNVLGYSDYYPQYPWTMQSDLDPTVKDKIRTAFLSLEDKEILKNFNAEGFAAADDSDYDIVREMAKNILGQEYSGS